MLREVGRTEPRVRPAKRDFGERGDLFVTRDALAWKVLVKGDMALRFGIHSVLAERLCMKRSLLLFRIVLICSCTFNRLPGSEYDWQRVYSDGAGGQLLGLEDFAFGGGVYVAVGDTNFASLNGKDWTPVASFRPNLSRVIYANGKFVAVGGAY